MCFRDLEAGCLQYELYYVLDFQSDRLAEIFPRKAASGGGAVKPKPQTCQMEAQRDRHTLVMDEPPHYKVQMGTLDYCIVASALARITACCITSYNHHYGQRYIFLGYSGYSLARQP